MSQVRQSEGVGLSGWPLGREKLLSLGGSWLFLALWTLLLGIVSFIFWRSFSYTQRLFRQPFLSAMTLPQNLENHQTVEAKALLIASANLRAGIEPRYLANGQEKRVLCAGLRNFREPWARDLGFAGFGLVELGEFEVVKESLEAFLLYQRPSGQFPVKLHATNVLDRYLHSLFKREQPTYLPLRPKYITAHNTISLDGNAILVIAMLNYARRSGDNEFVKTHWAAMKQTVTWLEIHGLEQDGLLHQAAFADWADSIARQGRVLYTNVLYWKVLHDLAQAAIDYGFNGDQAYFTSRAGHLRRSINEHFWREDLGYFVTNHIFDNLSSSGNLLAIAWDLATPAQAHSILDRMAEFEMGRPIPTRPVHRPYPDHFIAIENRLGGIANYHTSAAWLWLGAWHVIAAARMERLDEAEELLYRIAKAVVRDGAVHEVYAPTGQYLSTFWYTSEAPLTWSAGMIVYAHTVYQRHWAGHPIG